MDAYLNSKLYRLLDERMGGVVNVVNKGEAASYTEATSLDTRRPYLRWMHRGEQYVTRCPYCADHSGHLYFSHLYGTYSVHVQPDLFDLVKCFRSDCLQDYDHRHRLADRVFIRLSAEHRRNEMKILPGRVSADNGRCLHPVPHPGRLLSLVTLSADHPARQYIQNRGFDLVELDTVWGVRYAVEPCSYPAVEGRIVIPIMMDGIMVGWQARCVGEFTHAGSPKYLTMPGLPKRLVLYNYDRAKNQPFVVIAEGPSDVWRLGSCGVALLGKTISEQQIRLIHKHWGDKVVIVLLDSDDPAAAEDANKICVKLRTDCERATVLSLRLPEGLDPGDCPRDALHEFIRAAAMEQDVLLPQLGTTDDIIVRNK